MVLQKRLKIYSKIFFFEGCFRALRRAGGSYGNHGSHDGYSAYSGYGSYGSYGRVNRTGSVYGTGTSHP